MKTWKYAEKTCSLSLAKTNPILANLLAIRNIDTDEKAEVFLNPEKQKYSPFSVFVDAEKVLKRIQQAVEKSEKIIVYGDFDTDGVTSTAVMYKALTKIGANAGYYLPDRDSESHGLNNSAIVNLISKQRAKLIITVDCGISNLAEVKLAKSLRTDVIITDHHEAPAELPEAYAIINPKAQNVLSEDLSASEIESLCALSGAGIAYKLASAILKAFKQEDYIQELTPIAALGTIGDIVPLISENRRLAFDGINAIKNKVNKGITRLFENADIKDFSKITTETIAFTAVPRINATGRLERADIAFQLLVSDDIAEIDTITKKLNDINSDRQRMCEEAFERAEKIIAENPELYTHSIVIFDEQAHVGIIGLSASKLVEKYGKPAFVMKKDGNMYRCSCRGLQGVNIFDILNENGELFDGYGGHEFAGGFSFDGTKVTFEKVREAINNTVLRQTGGDVLPNILNIDLKLEPQDVTVNLLQAVEALQPCGASNPSPVFAVENVKIADYRFIGDDKNHLKFTCRSENGCMLDCIKWKTSSFDGQKNDKINIAFTPSYNDFSGGVQLLIKDFQLPELIAEKQNEGKTKILDCRYQKGGFDKIYDFLQQTKTSVAIFAENSFLVKEIFEENIGQEYVFNRQNLPENSDMIIFAEIPPSLAFLKNLLKISPKKLLFMKIDLPSENADIVLSKIAGMMNYAFKNKGGKAEIFDFVKALNFDEAILMSAVKVFKDTGMIDCDIKDGELKIDKFVPMPKEKLLKNKYYADFEKDYGEYYRHVCNLCNLSKVELYKYILG
ncbi:MAG: single-stranded-DNA-specific exonuclease RecJ [Candidatus Gastranaerophilales bacterium]|nr:single-stranded-DNA-specific exonuclease RecJ [Candidatus Gastranaerophilales bacterium]